MSFIVEQVGRRIETVLLEDSFAFACLFRTAPPALGRRMSTEADRVSSSAIYLLTHRVVTRRLLVGRIVLAPRRFPRNSSSSRRVGSARQEGSASWRSNPRECISASPCSSAATTMSWSSRATTITRLVLTRIARVLRSCSPSRASNVICVLACCSCRHMRRHASPASPAQRHNVGMATHNSTCVHPSQRQAHKGQPKGTVPRAKKEHARDKRGGDVDACPVVISIPRGSV